jgi:hypothetical protein
MTLTEFIDGGHYLPKFMRDFHDCKQLFKRIDELVVNRQNHDGDGIEGVYSKHLPNWTVAHIYVIDFFLWYMAQHGYTLQPSRKRVEFHDIHADLNDFERRRIEKFKNEMDSEHGTTVPTTPVS